MFRSCAGTGTFGRVRLCYLKDESKAHVPAELANDPRSTIKSGASPMPAVFALKIMKKLEVVRLKQVEHIRNEKEILQAINHPFLVTLYAVAQDERNLYMLLEFIIGGAENTLTSAHARRAPPLPRPH